jgi:fused signal recognition particle receptor
MGLFSKMKAGLKKTRESMNKSMTSMLHSFTRIDEDLFEELDEILVMSDVGVPTAERICTELRKRAKERGVTEPGKIEGMLRELVAEMLRGDSELKLGTKPSVILVVGVNGVGKTTTIGKIAAMLEKEGKKVILGAADTFRAAAVEQLDIWAKRAGAEIVSQPQGSDPAAVAFDAIAAAKSRGADVVICDTAGRMHNKKNLMEELAKINRVVEREAPQADREVLLVLDAATGQNAISQAREFKAAADITGIVLTKLDGTSHGGVVLAIREELGLPVKFIGVGEQLDDLQPFDADAFAEALFPANGG